MRTITREQAQKIIEAADEVITALAGTNEDVHPESDNMLRLWDDLNDRYAPPEVVRELARIALASLDAEPVAWRYRTTDINGNPNPNWSFSEEASLLGLYQPLYAAPPAPVSVPAELTREEYKRRFMEEDDFDATFRGGWNACRAAMLQGANGNSPVVPDGWVACSERMPDSDDFVYIWPRPDFGVELHVAQYGKFDRRDTGWYAQLYEQNFGIEYQPITVTHWMPLPAAPQQEVK